MSTEIDDMTTFGSRLAAARRKACLTQEQLGEGLGQDGADLGKGAISSWEVNRTEPSATQLRLLCQRLGISANDLLGVACDCNKGSNHGE